MALGIVTGSLLLFGVGFGAIGGWPTFGLWVAGFAPVVYGIVQLVRRRPRRGLVAIGAGLLAGIVGLSQVPPAPPADPAASVAARSPSTSATPSAPTSPSAPSAPSSSPAVADAAALVSSLVAKGNGPMTGYDRELFAWNGFDFDRNGCDQRNDVLRRDLTEVQLKPGSNGCRVESGWLQDRYSGTAVHVTRDQVEIDHVVALGNAWQTGAATWTPDRRARFANDPLNLVATVPALNRQKGDGNAATWLPPQGRCDYVARQAAVKKAYGLSVAPAEQQAMLRILAGCAGQRIPTGADPAPRQSATTSPSPTPPVSPPPVVAPPTTKPPTTRPPTTKPSTTKPPTTRPPTTRPPTTRPPTTRPPTTKPPVNPGTDPKFGTCKEAKAKGNAPYYKGRDPEYYWYNDRDNDGIVCE